MFTPVRLHFRENSLSVLILKLTTASLSFNSSGTPTSQQFDDVYFSNDNGLAESKYVFFDHNLLNKRWFSCDSNHFTIAETGFGTGLNFLLTWQLFREFKKNQKPTSSLQRLYFVSTEKFPIPLEQLQKALQQWPELQELSEQLLVQYPILTPGCHRLTFDQGSVILDLWLGDILDTLPSIQTYPNGIIDAWYLDGFAPSKNPDMWQEALFQNMARLSKPNCTFATFTAAGIVKRGLRENGFIVKKTKGFGRKRDMLMGYFAPHEARNKAEEAIPEPVFQRSLRGPWQRTAGDRSIKSVAIIGGGLAGANLAVALQSRGFNTSLYCKDSDLAMAASGNHQGGIYPSLNADFSVQSQFYCHAFDYARRYYAALNNQGFGFGHDWCGVFFPAFSDEVARRQNKLLSNDIWPRELIHSLTSEQATQQTGLHMPYSGLFIPEGGWIQPRELVQALWQKAASLGANLWLNHQLTHIQADDDGWLMHWHDTGPVHADCVVYATGSDSLAFPELADIPFTTTRGQVEHLGETANAPKPQTVICHKGYYTPFYKQMQAMGATFDKSSRNHDTSPQDTNKNFETIRSALAQCHWVSELPEPVEQRAAVRLSLPDHKPVMGAVPDFSAQSTQYQELYKARPLEQYPAPQERQNLYVLTGLGSHGLCTSPLLAEALACQLSGEPLPLSNELLDSVSPNRFLIRGLIRRKI